MNITFRCSLLATALLLGACADRSPDDVDGTPATDTAGPSAGDELASPGEGGSNTPSDADNDPVFFDPDLPDPDDGDTDGEGNDNDNGAGGTTDPADDPNPAVDPDAQMPEIPVEATPSDPAPSDQAPSDNPPEGPADMPSDESPEQPPTDTPIEQEEAPDRSPEPVPNPVDDDNADGTATAPIFPGRPDAGRVFAALTRMVGLTILDLNQRLSSGIVLSDAQTDCLQSFDPALGQTLFAIDCAQPLVTDTIDFAVGFGALADTDACSAALAAGTFDECLLDSGSATVRTRFDEVSGGRRPLPAAGSGVIIRYDVTPGVLEILREPDAPLADFNCGIIVATGASLNTDRGDCNAAFRDTANYVESLFAPS